ncbi:MAG: hypothetical protein V1926_04015 [Candidatus Peregrinibacteria bacterium]
MSKPRKNPHREIYGLLGSFPDASKLLKEWNERFRKQGIDATMEEYPATEKNLPERLSEMFYFDRRMYLVSSDLSCVLLRFLDEVTPMARKRGVRVVENRGGVLTGKLR